MFQVFRKNNQPCIYDPDQSWQFCISSGGTTIFDNIPRSVSTTRRSKSKKKKKQKIVVNITYTLCFALSQQNNYLQLDQTRFFMLKNLNKLPQLQEVMIEENSTLYSIPPSHNPNLAVDVLTSLSFPLKEKPFAAVINFQTLAQIFNTWK